MKKKEIRVSMSLLVLISLGSLLVQYNLMKERNTATLAKPNTYRVVDAMETETQFANKWIITASLKSSTERLLDGWTILLYEDANQTLCRFPHCVTLDAGELPNEWTEHAGINTRKIAAYLYAISNGAAFICILDIWTADIENILRRFSFEETSTGIVPVTGRTFVQPETLFSRVSANKSEHLLKSPENMFFQFVIDEHVTPGIHLGVNIAASTTYLRDNNQLPFVFLPAKTYTSLTSPVTLFRYDAFWALGLMEFGSRVWDSIVQKMLWSQSMTIGVFPTNGFKPRKKHVPGKVNTTLFNSWKCTERLIMYDCMMQLIELCQNETLVSAEEVKFAKLFFDELVSIGYHMYLHMLSFKPNKPSELNDLTNGILRLPSNVLPDSNVANEKLKEVCPDVKINFSNEPITDIALIVSFNYVTVYRNFALIEAMYRPYFRHIIFCGQKMDIISKLVPSSTVGYIIFLDAYPLGWWGFQLCIVEAMKLNLDVKGFLQIGDDTMLNPWNIYDLPRDKIWLTSGVRKLPFSLEKFDWQFWKTGKDRILNLFRKMKLNLGDSRNSRFFEQFGKNSDGLKYMFISGCDFMYMPVKYKEEFTYLTMLFIDSRIVVEIAYPTVALGIMDRGEVHVVEDGSLWRQKRQFWSDKYDENLVFMHPFKLITYLVSDEGKRLFCNFMKHPK